MISHSTENISAYELRHVRMFLVADSKSKDLGDFNSQDIISRYGIKFRGLLGKYYDRISNAEFYNYNTVISGGKIVHIDYSKRDQPDVPGVQSLLVFTVNTDSDEELPIVVVVGLHRSSGEGLDNVEVVTYSSDGDRVTLMSCTSGDMLDDTKIDNDFIHTLEDFIEQEVGKVTETDGMLNLIGDSPYTVVSPKSNFVATSMRRHGEGRVGTSDMSPISFSDKPGVSVSCYLHDEYPSFGLGRRTLNINGLSKTAQIENEDGEVDVDFDIKPDSINSALTESLLSVTLVGSNEFNESIKINGMMSTSVYGAVSFKTGDIYEVRDTISAFGESISETKTNAVKTTIKKIGSLPKEAKAKYDKVIKECKEVKEKYLKIKTQKEFEEVTDRYYKPAFTKTMSWILTLSASAALIVTAPLIGTVIAVFVVACKKNKAFGDKVEKTDLIDQELTIIETKIERAERNEDYADADKLKRIKGTLVRNRRRLTNS